MDLPVLHSKPVPQIAWYLQIKDKITESGRTIDHMTTLQISKMYEEGRFLCDTCGKELGKCDYSLHDHILHLINPMILWPCEDCYQRDLRSGRIVGWGKEPVIDELQYANR
jgi:hypothetical protein